MTNWENLARELVWTSAEIARTAKPSLNLSGFVHGAIEFVIFALQIGELVLADATP
jgi:hypothetical protein